MMPGTLQDVQVPTRKAFVSKRVNISKSTIISTFFTLPDLKVFISPRLSPDNTQIAITQRQDILPLDYIQDFSGMSKNKPACIPEM